MPNSHFGDATHCQGFIEALVPSALRIHEAYTILFPDLKALPTDKRLVERYFATLLLVDPNLCLPENLNAYVVASLIVKYGQSHPERMTDTQYKFASQALAEVYFCKASDK